MIKKKTLLVTTTMLTAVIIAAPIIHQETANADTKNPSSIQSMAQTAPKALPSGTVGTCTWSIGADGLLTIEEGELSVTSPHTNPWQDYLDQITSVKLSPGVKGAGSISGLFMNMNITSLDLSNFDTSQVTDMSYLFYGDAQLNSLDLSSLDTSQVTNMSCIFADTKLTSLDVSNLNTSQVTDMSGMFSGMSELTSLDLSNFDTSQVMNMGGMFNGVSKLSNLDLKTFNTSQVTNMGSMFNNSGIISLDLSNFDTSQVTTMGGMFNGMSKLTSLDLSSFDTTRVTTMGGMFENAPIKQLKLGNKTNLTNTTTPVDLVLPDTDYLYSGIWQTQGTGTVDQPNGDWVGTTDDLIQRSAIANGATYVWQPAVHDFAFTADDITVKPSEVAKLDIVKASKASVKDNKYPDASFTVVVKDNGGVKAKAGTYIVTLGVKELSNVTKKIQVKVTEDAPKPDTSYQTMYRVYNKNTGEHLYTASTFERDNLVKVGWSNEGIGWKAPTKGASVYRVYNPNAQGGDHYYTASKFEAQSLVKMGWKWDNGGKPVFYSGGKTKVYVAYNPNAKSGSHNYTTSQYEQNTLLNLGWKYSKVQFYGK